MEEGEVSLAIGHILQKAGLSSLGLDTGELFVIAAGTRFVLSIDKVSDFEEYGVTDEDLE